MADGNGKQEDVQEIPDTRKDDIQNGEDDQEGEKDARMTGNKQPAEQGALKSSDKKKVATASTLKALKLLLLPNLTMGWALPSSVCGTLEAQETVAFVLLLPKMLCDSKVRLMKSRKKAQESCFTSNEMCQLA